MTTDQCIALFAASISFAGLVFVGIQIRGQTKQQTLQAVVEIYATNRELIFFGFEKPQLFEVLAGKNTDAVLQRRYLQLWFNHFSLIFAYLDLSVLEGELKDIFLRDLKDFLSLESAKHHWHQYGQFYT